MCCLKHIFINILLPVCTEDSSRVSAQMIQKRTAWSCPTSSKIFRERTLGVGRCQPVHVNPVWTCLVGGNQSSFDDIHWKSSSFPLHHPIAHKLTSLIKRQQATFRNRTCFWQHTEAATFVLTDHCSASSVTHICSAELWLQCSLKLGIKVRVATLKPSQDNRRQVQCLSREGQPCSRYSSTSGVAFEFRTGISSHNISHTILGNFWLGGV